MQASDFMNDEVVTQELCRQAARRLFWSPKRQLPIPDQTSDQAASQGRDELSEDLVQVCFL